MSTTRWGARIRAAGAAPVGIVQVSGDYVDVRGFDVSGSGGDGTVGVAVRGSHVRVDGNRVHHVVVACDGGRNGGAGIVAGGGRHHYRNHDDEIAGNLVHDIVGTPLRSCPGVHGIYAAVPRVRILNNVVYGNARNCISSWHAATQLMIANNTVLGCPGAGISIGSGGSGATAAGNRHTVVANNLVYGNGRGIVEATDGLRPVGPGNRYLDNLVFPSQQGGALESGAGLYPGQTVLGTVHADPGFVGAARDYRLRAGSPAIDAGTVIGAPRRDFDGVRRPQGRSVDIGAYEWRPASGRDR